MLRTLSGNQATISFPKPIYVGELAYAGPLTWELGNDIGIFNPVDPDVGASNAAVTATIDPVNPQVLHLVKVADEVQFSIKASYPGVAGLCSRPSVSMDLIFSAPSVWINPLCVEIDG